MKRSFIFIFFAAGLAGYTLQWPVESPAVISAFGENRGDYYSSGIDISSPEKEVYASAEGEIVYYHEEKDSLVDLPSGLGSFMILEHDRQLRTSYAHLKSGSIKSDRIYVQEGEVIGLIGDSGASIRRQLNFKILDKEINEVINPLLLLPHINDKTKPVIKELYLKNPENFEIIRLVPGLTVKSGNYNILAEIYDLCDEVDYYCPTAPYQISVFVDNEEIETIAYNSLKTSENKTLLSGNNLGFSEYYIDINNQWLINSGAITLEQGRVQIEISAKDFSGNETVKKINVISEGE